MESRRKTGLAVVASLLLLAGVVKPLREVLVYPVVRHAEALVAGRPLEGFPPDQLDGYAAALARQELDALAAKMGTQDPVERRRLEARIEDLRVRRAQVAQEQVWYTIVHHPLDAAGVVLFLFGAAYAIRWWMGGRAFSRVRGRDVVPRRLPGLTHSLGKARVSEEHLEDAAEVPVAPGGDILEVPLEREVERLLAQEGATDSEPPFAHTLDPDWKGWRQAVRERMPPLEMAHLIALFASDSSRNYLGLLGFLSHQLALSGSERIHMFVTRKAVQVFLSAPDREQEIGELPPQQFAGLVVALSNALNLRPDGPTGRSNRWARLLVPSEQGYQLQEIRLYDNGIELRVVEHVRFLPAGW